MRRPPARRQPAWLFACRKIFLIEGEALTSRTRSTRTPGFHFRNREEAVAVARRGRSVRTRVGVAVARRARSVRTRVGVAGTRQTSRGSRIRVVRRRKRGIQAL